MYTSLECDKSSTKVVNNSKISSSTPKLKSNECTVSLECDKSSTKVSNNSKNSSSTPKLKSNECTESLEYDKSSTKVSNNWKKLFYSKSEIEWIYCVTAMW